MFPHLLDHWEHCGSISSTNMYSLLQSCYEDHDSWRSKSTNRWEENGSSSTIVYVFSSSQQKSFFQSTEEWTFPSCHIIRSRFSYAGQGSAKMQTTSTTFAPPSYQAGRFSTLIESASLLHQQPSSNASRNNWDTIWCYSVKARGQSLAIHAKKGEMVNNVQ